MTEGKMTTVTLVKDSDKKHSVLFKATEKDQALDNVYLRRPFADGARKVQITITVIE